MMIRFFQEKETKYLVAIRACRLIPLDKQQLVRPIGIDELQRGVIGKIVMKLIKKDIFKAKWSLQLWAGQETGVSQQFMLFMICLKSG